MTTSADWALARVKSLYRPIDLRAGARASELPLVSVSIHRGAHLRDEWTNDESRAESLDNYKVCLRGDIVLNRMRAFQGAVGVSPAEGLVSPDYLVMRPAPTVDGRYLHHLFRSHWFVGEMVSRLRGIGSVDLGTVRTPRINREDLDEIRLPIPALSEQRRIADFLDDQVGRMDGAASALADAREATMARSVAAITATVLGSEFAGTPACWRPFVRVPDGWREATLRNLRCSVQTGPFGSQLHADEYVEDGWPVVNPANISAEGMVAIPGMAIDDTTRSRLTRHVLSPGDVVFGRRGELGRAAVVTDAHAGWVCGTGSLFVRLGTDELAAGYLMRLLRTPALRYYFDQQAVGATMANLNTSILVAMPILLPPREEQDVIVERAALLEEAHTALSLQYDQLEGRLQERKRALITACVTEEFEVATASGRGTDVALQRMAR